MERQRKPPEVVYYLHPTLPRGRILRLNSSAAQLIREGGESYAILYKDRNGNLFIKPINIEHGEILSVNKIRMPKAGQGQVKIGATKLHNELELGRYEVVWDGMREALRIKINGRTQTEIL